MNRQTLCRQLAADFGGSIEEWTSVIRDLSGDRPECEEEAARRARRDCEREQMRGEGILPNLSPEAIAHALTVYGWERVYCAIRGRTVPVLAREVTTDSFDWYCTLEAWRSLPLPEPEPGDYLVEIDGDEREVQRVLVRGAHSAEGAIAAAIRQAEIRWPSTYQLWWGAGAVRLVQGYGRVVRSLL